MQTGGKKPLDVEINVVPFIDLMAVTIAFLLITAVWTQTGALPVAQRGGGGGEVSEEQPLSLRLTRASLFIGADEVKLPQLSARLEGVSSVSIVTDDDVQYDALVQLIDACRAAKVTGISVTPAS